MQQEEMLVIETNIDDMNPQFFDHVMERLFAAGARDVFLAPIQMKKNRPATLLTRDLRAAPRERIATNYFSRDFDHRHSLLPVSRMILSARIEESENPIRRSHGEDRRTAGRSGARAGIRRP